MSLPYSHDLYDPIVLQDLIFATQRIDQQQAEIALAGLSLFERRQAKPSINFVSRPGDGVAIG